jgi:hypothetical protein
MRGITARLVATSVGLAALATAAPAASAVPAAPAAAAAATPAAALKTQSWNLKLAIRYFPSAGNHSQYDTVVAEGRTGWFFGGSNFSGNGIPEVERFSNDQWHQSVLPRGLHSWITGASAVSANDIWAVTILDGAVLNWNGSQWVRQPGGRWRDKAQFTGIVALSPGNVWLFGGKGIKYQGAGTWHLSGSAWTQVKGMAADIYRASAVSATDMWGIGGIRGSMNALLRYRGSTWSHVTPVALSGFHYSYVLALSPTSVWVAGSVAGTPELGHYNGHGWTALTMPGTTQASAMCRDGRGGVWVIANSGFGPSTVLDRSASGNWTSAPVSQTSANEVLGCALIPRSQAAWGAGKSAAPAGTAAAVYGYGNVP